MKVKPNSYYTTKRLNDNLLRLLLQERIGQPLADVDLSVPGDFKQGKGWSLALQAILQPFVINSAYNYPGKTKGDKSVPLMCSKSLEQKKEYGDCKMKKFRCYECGKVCYSASKRGAKCLYCGGEVREVKREGVKK